MCRINLGFLNGEGRNYGGGDKFAPLVSNLGENCHQNMSGIYNMRERG